MNIPASVLKHKDSALILQFDPAEAVDIGLNEAIVLNQMRYWLKKPHHSAEEREWIYNSYPMWQEQFPFWSVDTVRRAIVSLETQGILESEMHEISRGLTCKRYRLVAELRQGVGNLPRGGMQVANANNESETPTKTSSEIDSNKSAAKKPKPQPKTPDKPYPKEDVVLREMQENWTTFVFNRVSATRTVRLLHQDFPDLDLVALAKAVTRWYAAGGREIKNWLNTLNNFAKNEAERQQRNAAFSQSVSSRPISRSYGPELDMPPMPELMNR